MPNMSNRFYDYLSNKLFDYFDNFNFNVGDKFFIHFDEEEQVLNFYKSLEDLARFKNIYSDFIFKHENSEKEYSTFSINFNGINMVIAESISVTIDYLVTLRNQVTAQEGVWKNTALLVICHEAVDSIYNGMRDLEKDGMPLSLNSISKQLENELKKSNNLTVADKEIIKFTLHNQYKDLFTITLLDYENILSIIDKGYLDDEDYTDLNLFKDDKLNNFKPSEIKTRLAENHDTFLEIKKVSQYDDKKEQLENKFTYTGVQNLNKKDWYNTDWQIIKRSRDSFKEQKNPLGYIENKDKVSENGLIYWDKPNANTKTGNRTRNIIVFNDKSFNNVELKFNFDQFLSDKYISSRVKKYAETSGKSLKIYFELYDDKPTYKQIVYNHKDETKSRYTFNIVVLNSKPEIFESIKSRFKVHTLKKEIIVINDEDNYDIIFGSNKNPTEKLIEDENEIIDLFDNDAILISDKSPLWNEGNLLFYLNYNDNLIKFEIFEKSKRTVPVKSSVIWNLKRKNKENFIFNGSKAVQDINSFYLDENFKDFLNIEREMIKDNVFYGNLNVDGTINKKEVHFSEDLEKAYMEILDYYKFFDDSPEDNLPSLMYLNDKLKKLYKNFIDIFNQEIEEIEENSTLSDYPLKKDLIKLGRIDTENKIMYSSLSPINIAYQLEVSKQCNNENLIQFIADRLVPNNLVPYIYSEDSGELFKPIYQEYAHEWLIYEKSDLVSLGTTNVFIANVVSEKLNQFSKHFDYLFNINPNIPLKINLININDDMEIVKGVFNFIRSRLPDKVKTKNIIPVEINIYNDYNKTSFEQLFECDSKEDLFDVFKLKIHSEVFDEIDVIHNVQNNIEYYIHSNNENYGYAHISFYNVNNYDEIANDKMEDIETGLSLNGLISSVTSSVSHSEYRTGFGTKNIYDKDNLLVKTAINFNELVENSRNHGKNIYSKNKSIVTTVELNDDEIKNLYNNSQWITFIEPAFGLEYFDKSDDLIIVHYSDQYSSSNKYDTITVTNKSNKYYEIIKNFLKRKNIKITNKNQLTSVIKLFNSINGEWLLKLTSNNKRNYEKFAVLSAIKYSLSILMHENIIWVPISIEEIVRIAGNIGLNNNSLLLSYLKEGVYSNDLLFIGLKPGKDNSLEVIYYPIKVKTGIIKEKEIKKDMKHLLKITDILNMELNKINSNDEEFTNKFFRNFLIQIFLSNVKKLNLSNILNENDLNIINKFKNRLLNDYYDISNNLIEYIGKASLIKFDSKCVNPSIYKNSEDVLIIELPKNKSYQSLIKTLNQINEENLFDKVLVNVDIPKFNKFNVNEDNENNIIQNNNANLENNQINIESNIEDNIVSSFDNQINNNSPIANENFISLSNKKINDISNVSDDIVSSDNKNELLGNSINKTIDSNFDMGNNVNSINKDIEFNSEEDLKFNNDIKLKNVKALIGTETNGDNKIYWEFGNLSLGNRHILIQGKSGQGKTYFIQRILNDLSHQGIPSVIIDYTDGFKKSKLDNAFKESLNDKIVQKIVYTQKFPLNPFKKNMIELDEDVLVPESNVNVAGRFKSVVNSVYTFGDQQLNAIYDAVLMGLNDYGDNMDLIKLKEELSSIDESYAVSALNKLRELFDINPFESNQFDWADVLDNNDGKVMIIQLTGLSKDIQKIITELILWDLWYYKMSNGNEDKPFIVVLDEAQNLDFSSDSPCSKILTEGRKFGWSGWFATQSVKGMMKSDAIAKLENAEEKFYFHPTDNSISSIAGNLSKDNSQKKLWETRLSKLNKGQCILQGSFKSSSGKSISKEPIIVDINPIKN